MFSQNMVVFMYFKLKFLRKVFEKQNGDTQCLKDYNMCNSVDINIFLY